MTTYADYTFYSVHYLVGRTAAMKESAFPYYAMQASSEIDRSTFGNINPNNIPEKVRLCCCELAEIIYAYDVSQAKQKHGLASESVQGWSQSYESTEARQKALQCDMRNTVYKWLIGTGLLFSGVL